MKKLLLCLCMIMTLGATAQKIKVLEENVNIEKILVQGFFVVVDLDVADMQKAWKKQLKTYGKVSNETNYSIIPKANVPSFLNGSMVAYSKTTESPNGLKIWLSIANASSVSEVEQVKSEKQARTILHDFAATSYINNINEQIKDAEAALILANKNEERTVKKSEYIDKQISKNGEEKLLLEEKLKKNGEDLILFKKQKVDNAEDKKKAAEEVERMKRVAELVKLKLKEIN